MTTLVGVYGSFARLNFAMALQYRSSQLIWMGANLLQMFVLVTIWAEVSRSNGGSVAGYGAGQLTGYFIVGSMVNLLIMNWTAYEISKHVQRGTMSGLLLRPVHPVHEYMVAPPSHFTFQLAATLPVACWAVWRLGADVHPTVTTAIFLSPVLVMAIVLSFLVNWIIGSVAFWFERSDSIANFLAIPMSILRGGLAPVALLPPTLGDVANMTPFPLMVAYPVELALGMTSAGDALRGLALQAVWAVVLFLVARTVWKAGLNRYSAVGA